MGNTFTLTPSPNIAKGFRVVGVPSEGDDMYTTTIQYVMPTSGSSSNAAVKNGNFLSVLSRPTGFWEVTVNLSARTVQESRNSIVTTLVFTFVTGRFTNTCTVKISVLYTPFGQTQTAKYIDYDKTKIGPSGAGGFLSTSDLRKLTIKVTPHPGVTFEFKFSVSPPLVLGGSLSVVLTKTSVVSEKTLPLKKSTTNAYLIGSCPDIAIYTSADVLSGSNPGQVIYRVRHLNGVSEEWQNYLPITKYAAPCGPCTLVDKNILSGAETYTLINYSSLRVFLWFLITGKWKYSIVLQRNTEEFFACLASSQYKCFITQFTEGDFVGYDRYFLV